ncbi:hypothetical protein D3C72_2007710 [compost metagenome]
MARPTWTGASDEVNDMSTPCHENWICPKMGSAGAKLLIRPACMVRESGASFSRHSTWYSISSSVLPRISIMPSLRYQTSGAAPASRTAVSVAQISAGPARSHKRDATLTASP